MSSLQSAPQNARDAGRRRITAATAASAAGGTALAVLFGTVFAHGAAGQTAAGGTTATPAVPLAGVRAAAVLDDGATTDHTTAPAETIDPTADVVAAAATPASVPARVAAATPARQAVVHAAPAAPDGGLAPPPAVDPAVPAPEVGPDVFGPADLSDPVRSTRTPATTTHRTSGPTPTTTRSAPRTTSVVSTTTAVATTTLRPPTSTPRTTSAAPTTTHGSTGGS